MLFSDQIVARARLFFLAVALWLCCAPTAQALRQSTSTPPLPSARSQFKEAAPCLELGSEDLVWIMDGHGRIGLIVGNNPINEVDYLGLKFYVSVYPFPENDFHTLGPYTVNNGDGSMKVVDGNAYNGVVWSDARGINDLSVDWWETFHFVCNLPRDVVSLVKTTVLNAGRSKCKDVVTSGGRSGKQTKLPELATDQNVSSADRGWIRQEKSSIERGDRTSIRVPPGKNLAHRRGLEAKDGNGYEHSDLQDIDLHKLQHKHEGY